jgi:putative selenate reductase
MKLGEVGHDGRREVVPVINEFENFEIDFIISAIGEKIDLDILGRNKISINKYGKVQANSATNETLLKNVFIGGDALRGPSTVVESIADGKKAAEAIIKRENLQISFDKSFNHYFDKKQRSKRIAEQKGNVFSLNQLTEIESSRCLECNFICNKCVDVCPNRANIPITVDRDNFKDISQILHIDWMCNECGNCETFCPHNGSPYKDKVTLFRNEREFNNSRNSGFYVSSDDGGLIVISRFNSMRETFRSTRTDKLLDYSNDNDEEKEKFLLMISKIITDYSYLLNPIEL